MRVQLRIGEGRILEAAFQCSGCVPFIACGSCLTEWVTGKTVLQARTLAPEELEESLEGLPVSHRYCTEIAVAALQNALDAAEEEVPGDS